MMYRSDDRGWGKTTILNEIGFVYQALGYEVYLITQFTDTCHRHYATCFVDNETNVLRRSSRKAIAIIDEYDINQKFIDLINELELRQIPYVGFAK